MFTAILFISAGAFAQATPDAVENEVETKIEKPDHQVNRKDDNSGEVLLEPEVSRSERAQRMKKILQEVRQDLNSRKQNQKKSEAPKSGDDSSTN